ncbi:MAG TPA: sigma-70 family RNA polymerase sigma factor [Vicinamibacteria bacterium]|nr:sigma-70 family RNA polymerase sigma factor [Vicinamibacteria bacterium]
MLLHRPMDNEPARPQITGLLRDWQGGDARALERLIPLVYDELHALASRHLSRERPGHTLQTTALVHEAYLRLAGQRRVDWQGRAHFFGIAARLMRRILVDHARRERRKKRGARAAHLPIGAAVGVAAPAAVDAVDACALDRALSRLEGADPQQARIVELRFFGGMTVPETAEVLGISAATVKREWAVARAWLYRELSAGETPAAGDD